MSDPYEEFSKKVAEKTIKELHRMIEDLKEFIEEDCYCHRGHSMVHCNQNEDRLSELGIKSKVRLSKSVPKNTN